MSLDVLLQIEALARSLRCPSTPSDLSPLLLLPNASERVAHKTTLLESSAQLDAQHEAIVRVVTNLEELGRELHRKRALVKNALAPVSSLPPEILAGVFDYAVNTSEFSTNCAQAISQTTSLWRAIALKQPALWQRIASIPLNNELHPRIIPLLLPRTLGRPLSLHINAHDASAELLRNQVVRNALESLFIDASSFSSRSWKLSSLRRLSGQFPVLQTLSIVTQESHETVRFHHRSILDGNSPSLRSLRLQGCMARSIKAPCLESLDLSCAEAFLSDLQRLFELCTSLKSVSLRLISSGDEHSLVPETNGVCELPHLETLGLDCMSVETLSHVLWIIKAPKLRSLLIRDEGHLSSSGVSLKVPNLFEKSPIIEQLVLSDIPSPYLGATLNDWTQDANAGGNEHGGRISRLGSLKHLEITTSGNDDGDLDAESLHPTIINFIDTHILQQSPTVTLPSLALEAKILQQDPEWYTRRFMLRSPLDDSHRS